MKRFFVLLLAAAVLFCLASCSIFGSEEQSGTSSSATVSGTSSVTSEDASDTTASDDGSQQESDDTSVIPDNPGYEDLWGVNGYEFSKAAIKYRTAFTKEKAVYATQCVTNQVVGITAIYDGSVTRFFDAVNGAYYHAIPGKFLYPCYGPQIILGTEPACGSAFLRGDMYGFDSKSSGSVKDVSFERIKDENGADTVKVSYNVHAGHAIELESDLLYCEADSKLYLSDADLCRLASGALPCRFYASGRALWVDYFEDDDLFVEVDRSKLGKYGVASNQEIIIPFEYDLIVTAQNFEGDLGVYLAVKDGRSYYFSSNGKNLTPNGFDCGSQPFKNRAWVFEDGQGWIIEFR